MSTPDSAPEFGFTDDQLATLTTVFRDDLFAGKTVIVSGAGSGLGKAIAMLFARLGARLAICGRNEEKLEDARALFRRHTDTVLARAMTIRDPAAVEGLIASTCERFGQLDVLVNNAGGQFPQAAIDFSDKGWHAVIDTNLNGSWYMMQSAAQRWRDEGVGGNIVNVVATVERGMPQVAHTCAARAGVIYLSKTVSTEWAPLGIRVNCIAPGSVETEGFEVYPPEASAAFKNTNPMRRLGDAYDIAEAVVYLSAPSGKFITGEVLTVDGGHTQWGDVWPAGIPEDFKVNGR